jgi:hypothetical protein
LLAPQRGLIATAQNKSPRPKLSLSPKRTAGTANRSLVSLESDAAPTPDFWICQTSTASPAEPGGLSCWTSLLTIGKLDPAPGEEQN